MSNILVDILYNVIAILALVYCFTILARSWRQRAPIHIQVASGVLFGICAITGMVNPFEIEPGVFVDARTIPIILASPFCGIWASPIAGVIAGVYRYALGGVGTIAGIGAIVLAVLLGLFLAWRWRGRSDCIQLRELFYTGILASILGIASIFLISAPEIRYRVLAQLTVPIAVIYPLAVIFLGKLLIRASRLETTRVKLEIEAKERNIELEEIAAHLKEEVNERKKAEVQKEKVILELEKALSEIKTLQGILPFCSFCKKIRDDKGYWEQVDVYLRKYSQADISHGVCPDCMKKHYPKLYEKYSSEKKTK